MKTLLFALVFLLTCALVRAGDPPTSDPWAVLKTRENLVSADALAEARKAVFEEAKDTHSKTVARLVRLWKDNGFSHPATMTWACELAGPDDVGMILQAVREVLKREHDPQHPELTDRLNRFFFHDCLALWDEMPDPDRLVQLLEEGGRTIWHLPFSPAERDRLRLAKLKQQRAIVPGEMPHPWAGPVSSNALAGLLRFARDELHGKSAETVLARLAEERCQIALDTLANHSVVEALPLVKELLTKLEDVEEPAALIGKLRLCALKLEHENDTAALLEVVKTERNNASLLHWAAWRYLMIGGELGRLHEALAGNRAPAQTGRYAGEDPAASLLYVIFGEEAEGPDTYVTPDGKQVTRLPRDFALSIMIDWFLLDGKQVQDMLDLADKARDNPDSEASEALLNHTYGAILERAASRPSEP
jgi:hypothetical protein